MLCWCQFCLGSGCNRNVSLCNYWWWCPRDAIECSNAQERNKSKILQSANNIISKLVSPAFLRQCIEDESFSVLEFQTTYPVLVLFLPVNGVEKFMGFVCVGGWIYHCIKNQASLITARNSYIMDTWCHSLKKTECK